MPYSTKYNLSPESLAKVQAFQDKHEKLYTIQEVAAITGRSIYTLRLYMSRGKLQRTKIRGRVYFTEEQIEAFLNPDSKEDK